MAEFSFSHFVGALSNASNEGIEFPGEFETLREIAALAAEFASREWQGSHFIPTCAICRKTTTADRYREYGHEHTETCLKKRMGRVISFYEKLLHSRPIED